MHSSYCVSVFVAYGVLLLAFGMARLQTCHPSGAAVGQRRMMSHQVGLLSQGRRSGLWRLSQGLVGMCGKWGFQVVMVCSPSVCFDGEYCAGMANAFKGSQICELTVYPPVNADAATECWLLSVQQAGNIPRTRHPRGCRYGNVLPPY